MGQSKQKRLGLGNARNMEKEINGCITLSQIEKLRDRVQIGQEFNFYRAENNGYKGKEIRHIVGRVKKKYPHICLLQVNGLGGNKHYMSVQWYDLLGRV